MAVGNDRHPGLSSTGMRTGLVANAVVLVGIAWLATLGSSGVQSKSVLSAATPTKAFVSSDIEALESRAVLSPSVETITALAALYIDHGQSGLACGAIERAPRDIQLDPRVADVHVRALFHRGRAREALAVAEDSLSACEADALACRSWQVAKVRGEASFLREVVSAGIDDPMSNPAGVRAAYERSNERMGRVAMR